MEQSKVFLECYAARNADIVLHTPSLSQPDLYHLVFREGEKWSCDCTAGIMRQECKHVRKAMKETGNDRKCFYCGTTEYAAGGMQEHHVRRRSIHPEMIDDDKNKMLLCARCHNRATNDHEFEENLVRIWDIRHENKTRGNDL